MLYGLDFRLTKHPRRESGKVILPHKVAEEVKIFSKHFRLAKIRKSEFDSFPRTFKQALGLGKKRGLPVVWAKRLLARR